MQLDNLSGEVEGRNGSLGTCPAKAEVEHAPEGFKLPTSGLGALQPCNHYRPSAYSTE